MLRWLQNFIRRQVIANVPAELDLCMDCGEFRCSEGEWRECARRKANAAQLAAARAAMARRAGPRGGAPSPLRGR